MVIGINASKVSVREKSGIEFVVENVIDEFVKVTRNEGDTLILYVQEDVGAFPSHVVVKKLSWPFGKFWTQVSLGWELLWHPPDAFLDLSNFLPFLGLLSSAKKYFFAHDVAFLEYHQHYVGRFLALLGGFLYSSLFAKAVFTPTEYSKDRIVRFYPFCRKKIFVVGLGLKKTFVDALHATQHKEENKGGKEGGYFLYVGRIDPKKNLKNLIVGFHAYNINHGLTYRLVLCGRKDFPEIEEFITKENIPHVLMTGFVSEEELTQWYQEALGVVLVSQGEGFGLPILEGLAAGKPVLVSTHTGGVAETLKNYLTFCQPDAKGIEKGFEELAMVKTDRLNKPLRWETFEDVVRRMYRIIKS